MDNPLYKNNNKEDNGEYSESDDDDVDELTEQNKDIVKNVITNNNMEIKKIKHAEMSMILAELVGDGIIGCECCDQDIIKSGCKFLNISYSPYDCPGCFCCRYGDEFDYF